LTTLEGEDKLPVEPALTSKVEQLMLERIAEKASN